MTEQEIINLGPFSKQVFRIGGFSIHWYGLILASAVLVGAVLILREAKRQKINPDFFMDYLIYAIPIGVIVSRLYYVVFRWDVYRHNLGRVFAIWEGGLAIHGAIIGGVLVLIYLAKKRQVNFWQAVDILAPAVILAQAIGRWGNFINQEAHGRAVSYEFISNFPTFIQRQMYKNGQFFNPTFLYESLWNLLVFGFLIWIRRKDFIKKGDVFLLYLISYSVGRFFIEGLRTDSLMLGGFRVAQVLSVLLIIGSSIFFYLRHNKGQVS